MGLRMLLVFALHSLFWVLFGTVSAKGKVNPFPYLVKVEFYDYYGNEDCLGVILSSRHIMSFCSTKKEHAFIKSLDGGVALNIIENNADYEPYGKTGIMMITLPDKIKIGAQSHAACIPLEKDSPKQAKQVPRMSYLGNSTVVKRTMKMLPANSCGRATKDGVCLQCTESFQAKFSGDPVFYIDEAKNKIYLMTMDASKRKCSDKLPPFISAPTWEMASWIKSKIGDKAKGNICKYDWKKQ